ncbi:MAG: N-acetylneuraminate synthase [Gracilimonas sp.]|uniref:N-acetylneuraminate synthase n=1 Tax=Gracilimonas sp. TaxID=1974203 RepID=UPI001B2D019F|nr:N-acetylneuraminate synthase [Gracilimonas sp.]MBO6587230.1 N-acetylneuraminate synthase [Gracilimonas sp.]MBO6614282.1 N-acetylneuraminate synthase [Gracilimonas sp.]
MIKTVHVYIIAEAGVNHNGDIQKAIELIEAANQAGADAVKFQSFNADKLVSKSAKKAKYQSENMGGSDNSQYNMLKSLELSEEDHSTLIKECEKRGIQFLSTAFDADGIDFLSNLGLPVFKSPSGEITNYPFLKRLAKNGKPVILSTGMAHMEEVKAAVQVLTNHGLDKKDITVLHCNTEYPTPMEDVNLKAMNTIRDELGVEVGYSDHTLGIEVPIAAVALGAKIIEKHFTLDRNLPGPDHRASLEPGELKDMVLAIRNIEQAISGIGKKEPSESEKKNIKIARKSIHTLKPLKKGHIISEVDIIPLRPANGISPMKWNEVIGKKVIRDLKENEMLTDQDIA